MKKVFRFLLGFVFFIALMPQLNAQTVVTIGNNCTGEDFLPINVTYNYSYSQTIFSSEELMAGEISSISYKFNSEIPTTISSQIYLGEVSKDVFANPEDFVSADSLTLVYSGDVTFTQGWVTINFTTPFDYSGENNLVVAYMNNTGTWTDARFFTVCSSVGSKTITCYRGNQEISINNPQEVNSAMRMTLNNRPNVKFEINPFSASCYPPTEILSQQITSQSATLTWNAVEGVEQYAVAYKKSSEVLWDTTFVNTNSIALSQLDVITTYDVKIWSVCSGEESIAFTTSFTTLPPAELLSELPFECNFNTQEESQLWTILNGTQTNKWYWGNIVNSTLSDLGGVSGAMYISDDEGVTNHYNGTYSIVYFSRYIQFSDAPEFKLTFDWKGIAEGNSDFLQVFLVPTTTVLNNNIMLTEGEITDKLSGVNNWQREEVVIPGEFANGVYNLVFMWRNDISVEHQPPAAVDNISIEAIPCGRVMNLAAEVNGQNLDNISATITFDDNNTEEGRTYLLEYSLANTNEWVSLSTTENSVVLEGLQHTSRYSVRVKVLCSSTEVSDYSEIINFNTPCGVISQFPWTESFEDLFVHEEGSVGDEYAPKCWEIINGGSSYYGWEQSDNNATNGFSSLSFYGYETSGTYSDWLVTPLVEFDGNQRLTLKIKKSELNNNPTFKVYYYDASEQDIASLADTSLFELLDTVVFSQNTLDFKKIMVDLSDVSFLGRIALVVDDRVADFYIDEFTIDNTPLCPDVFGITVNVASSTSMVVSFDNSNPVTDGWTIAYGQADSIQAFNPELANTIIVQSNDTLPVTINNLNTGVYYLAVKSNCGGAYSEIETIEIPVVQNLPYTQNFDNPNLITGWNFQSNSSNVWTVGTLTNGEDSVSESILYVSENNGMSNTYNNGLETYAYAYTNLVFGEFPAFNISFSWRANGEGTYDYGKVYLLPYNYVLSSYTLPDDDYSITGRLNNQSEWQSKDIELGYEYANGVYKLVFAWKNDSNGGSNPPLSVDNLFVEALTCGPVETLTLNNIEATTPSISVAYTDHNSNGVDYLIEYTAENQENWISIVTDTNYYVIDSLNSETTYHVKVAVLCENGTTTSFVEEVITTPCGVISQFPWTEDFSGGIGQCWYQMLGDMSDTVTYSNTLNTNSSNGWKYNTYDEGESMFTNLSYEYAKYWIISPVFNLGNGETIYQLSADVYRKSPNGGTAQSPNGDRFAILVSTDDGNTWATANAMIFGSGENSTYDYPLSIFNENASNIKFKLADANDQPFTGNVRIAFFGEGTTSRIVLDNLEISQWQPCQIPSMVNVGNITATSAELTFMEFGQATQWEYVFSQGNTISTSATPVLINYPGTYLNDLLDGMTYSVAVRGVCGESYSEWSDTITFTTPSQPTQLPFETSFDNEFDNQKWVSTSNTNNVWAIGTATSYDAGGKSAYMSSNGESYNVSMPAGWNYTYACLYREFDFGSGGVDYILSFDYKVSGYPSWDMGIQVFIVDENEEVVGQDLYHELDNSLIDLYGQNNWARADVELSGLEGIKKIVFFTWGYTASYSTQSQVPPAIDNISIEDMICEPPTNLVVSDITSNSAVVSWNGEAENYKINCVVAGQSDTLSYTTSATTYTLPLSSFESYEVNVQSVCEEELYSLTTENVSFTTLQDADTIPYTCNFEGVGNNGWLLRNGGCINQWTIGVPVGQTSSSLFISDDEETAHYAAYGSSVVIAEKLFQFGNSEFVKISFDLTIGGEISSNIFYDYLKVFLLPEDQILEPTNSLNLNETHPYALSNYSQDVILQYLGTNAICMLDSTTTINITIPTPLNEQRKLVFLWRNNEMSGTQPGAIIDNISITTLGGIIEEECLVPINLTVSDITSNSANLVWTPAGEETAWQVKVNEQTPVDVTSPNHVLTDLLPSTEYSVSVRANCGTGVSEWATTTFTTSDTVINPVVTTLTATAIAENSAILNASVEEGNVEIVERGFYYKESLQTEWDSITAEGESTFSVQLSNLLAQTSYTYKAYVRTAENVFEGAEVEFTTEQSSLADVNNELKVEAYPNPTNDKVNIEIKGLSADARLIMTDVQGRVLKDIEINSRRNELDLKNFASGVYYIKVFDNHSTKTIKIIKE